MKKNSGFTLIELIVVVIIIGVLAAIVGPWIINSISGGDESALILSNSEIKYQAKDGSTLVPGAPPTGDYRVMAETPSGEPVTLDVRDTMERGVGKDWYQKTKIYNILQRASRKTPKSTCISVIVKGKEINFLHTYPNIKTAKETSCL